MRQRVLARSALGLGQGFDSPLYQTHCIAAYEGVVLMSTHIPCSIFLDVHGSNVII